MLHDEKLLQPTFHFTGIVNLGTLKSPATDVEHKCYWETVVPEAENSQCG